MTFPYLGCTRTSGGRAVSVYKLFRRTVWACPLGLGLLLLEKLITSGFWTCADPWNCSHAYIYWSMHSAMVCGVFSVTIYGSGGYVPHLGLWMSRYLSRSCLKQMGQLLKRISFDDVKTFLSKFIYWLYLANGFPLMWVMKESFPGRVLMFGQDK